MITYLKYKTKTELANLTNFISSHVHSDFYYTENNRRIFVNRFKVLKNLLNQSHHILVSKDKEAIDGVIMIWKGIAEDSKRSYIKINTLNNSIAIKLITVLLWNITTPLYVKIKKDSPYKDAFRSKRFIFVADRGRELLISINR